MLIPMEAGKQGANRKPCDEILPCFVCAAGAERPMDCQDVFGKEGVQVTG